jgi:C_GCAxxG_C_C family probable redox protein
MKNDRVEEAVSIFEAGYVCSQAVLTPYAGLLDLARETGLKLAEAFGAGMGCMGKTCGAVTGAYMVIGLKYGRTQAEDSHAKEKTRTLVKEFTRRFEKKHGTITCNDLIKFDISSPEGKDAAEKSGVFDTFCPGLVRDACEILEQLLDLD